MKDIVRVGALVLLVELCALFPGCGSGGSSGSTGGSGGTTTFSISGPSSTVLLGNTVQFTGNQTVTGWTVNAIAGGNSTVGTITASGLYTAPAILPASTAITIGATSASSSATAALTITSDVAVAITGGSSASAVLTSSTVILTATISSKGDPSTAVAWTVGGVANGDAQVGTITPGTSGAAVYTAPAVQPSASIQITATSVADTTKSATLNLSVQGILLSASSGTPGQVINLTGNFNVAEPLLITFSDGVSFQPSISVTPSSSSQATIVVPMYPTASGFGQGTVTVSAAQQSAVGSAPGFEIEALPAAPGATGAVTLAALQQTSAVTAESQNLWTLVGAASGGTVSTAGITNTTADVQTHLQNLIGSVSQVANGGTGFSVGTLSGSNIQINASTLAMMDAIFQAYILNSPQAQAAISRLPRETLARLNVRRSGRTPEENLRAFTALGPESVFDWNPTSGQLILGAIVMAVQAAATVGTVAVLSQAVAVLAIATVIDTEFFDGYMTNAIVQIFMRANDASLINAAETDETILETATTDSGATLAGDIGSLDSDLQSLGTLLDPTNPSSPGSQANSDQPTISNNAPTPPAANSTPNLNLVPATTFSSGEILLNVQVTNAPPSAEYSVTTSWGATDTILVDPYGFGFGSVLTPVPSSGTCYNGTVYLSDAAGLVTSVTGCFGAANPTCTGKGSTTITPALVVMPPLACSGGTCSSTAQATYANTSSCPVTLGMTAPDAIGPPFTWQGYNYDLVVDQSQCYEKRTLQAFQSCTLTFDVSGSPEPGAANTGGPTYTIGYPDGGSSPTVQVTVTPP